MYVKPAKLYLYRENMHERIAAKCWPQESTILARKLISSFRLVVSPMLVCPWGIEGTSTSTCRTRQQDGCWTTTSKSKIKIKKVVYAFCTQHFGGFMHFVSNTFGVRASPTHENKRCLCNLYPLLEFESQKVDLCILYPTRVRNTEIHFYIVPNRWTDLRPQILTRWWRALSTEAAKCSATLRAHKSWNHDEMNQVYCRN